jgi:hypothetical protein
MNNEDKNIWWFKLTYNNLVERAKTRGLDKSVLEGYYEVHHIIPRCMGGTDDKENLVLLNYREHVICHVILVRLNPDNVDLIRAADFMLNVDRYDENGNKIVIKLKSSRIAEKIKIENQKYNRGIYHPSYGTHISEEHKKILSEVNSRKRDMKTRINMSNAWLGTRHTDESKKKMSEAKKGKPRPDLRRPRPARKVKGKDGEIFPSIAEAARKYNVSRSAILGWIKREQGFSFIEN